MTDRQTGKPSAEMYAEEQAWLMGEKLTVRCSLCNGRRFTRTGPAGDVIRLIAEHRAEAHPEVVRTPRNRTFRQRLAAAHLRRQLAREAAA